VKKKSFQASREFLGLEHFPYGIDRSGQFTRNIAQLLMENGYAYEALDNGSRLPATTEEKLFVAFCRGEREAQSIHEIAWQQFVKKTTQIRACVSLAGLGVSRCTNYNEGDDEY